MISIFSRKRRVSRGIDFQTRKIAFCSDNRLSPRHFRCLKAYRLAQKSFGARWIASPFICSFPFTPLVDVLDYGWKCCHIVAHTTSSRPGSKMIAEAPLLAPRNRPKLYRNTENIKRSMNKLNIFRREEILYNEK